MSHPMILKKHRNKTSIAQMKIGFFSWIATRCASSNVIFQGIVRHRASADGCNCCCSLRNSDSFNSAADNAVTDHSVINHPTNKERPKNPCHIILRILQSSVFFNASPKVALSFYQLSVAKIKSFHAPENAWQLFR